MGECTGHAVRGGSNIVLMAQECTSLIVPVAKKLISRITGFEKKLAISKAGQFLSKVVPEEDKSKRK